MGITPIADLCHFGLPEWAGGFQNAEWPQLFARYAAAFAERYSWIRMFTPVNEIRVCASFSALHGKWNERLKSEAALVNAIRNMARATILGEEAILRITPDAKFVQSEATTHVHAAVPGAKDEANRQNELRYLALDLCYGRDVSAATYEYLLDLGFTRDEYDWFRAHGKALNPSCIMGNDYYASNEHMIDKDGKLSPSGEIYGYYILTREYYRRYRLPIMYTETNNLSGQEPQYWLRKEWANAMRLKGDRMPLVGFTWYSLTDQMDWDTSLAEDNHRVTPVGLFDLDRKIKPVGARYRELIADWRPEIASSPVKLPQ
jgi:beta-glucosidase/6-phospho-beta-glucosidase/beta-galactosidase